MGVKGLRRPLPESDSPKSVRPGKHRQGLEGISGAGKIHPDRFVGRAPRIYVPELHGNPPRKMEKI